MTTSAAVDDATMATARRYDGVTITFHWLTTVLVVVLFGSAMWWSYAPRRIGFRFELEDIHVALGIALAAVLIGRLAWRAIGGRRLPPAGSGLDRLFAGLVHALLYVLVAAQVVLGFALRWLQGSELSFFGLFELPTLLARNRGAAELLERLHLVNGWTIAVLAGGHAAMALVHHYLLRDGVLRRMLPQGR